MTAYLPIERTSARPVAMPDQVAKITAALNHKMDDYYHRGPTIESPTADLTPNWDPCHIEAYLSQQMHLVGEFSYVLMRGQVVVAENYTLSPDNARHFAAVLVDLADQADALSNEPQ